MYVAQPDRSHARAVRQRDPGWLATVLPRYRCNGFAGEEAHATLTHPAFDLHQSLARGETSLRDELGRLAPWHLIDLIVAHHLSGLHRADLNRLPRETLTDIIVINVRAG